ncbi:MAG TPA: cysteine desulfurase NifS [Candidatus Brocadiia bacterium]|nr:cysteine desulfurase NifS [Candidatus Brocadiia bacterium]
MNTVYLDNNATTAVAPEVLDEMLPFLKDRYGNPSSAHSFGGGVARDIDRARQRLAALLGADPSEILFTSCGTESDSTAIWSCLNRYPDRRRIVTTRVEHPAVRSLVRLLAERGCQVVELPVNSEGLLDMAEVDDAITPDTAVVSVMWANNETGVVFPVEEIARLCRDRGVVFHTDAVQAVGKIPINMAASAVDMLSLSGHKLHAPKGVGALYIRRGTRFAPFLVGGHQEHGRRGGTENVASIVGLGKAAELAAARMNDENTRVRGLRDRLENELLRLCPDASVNGSRWHRLPNTASISFQYIEGEAILLHMDREGIAASSGSACTSGSLEPSHVLRAMGVPFTRVHGSIRFSLSYYNTDRDVDYAIEKIPPIIRRLRELSPFGRPGARAMVEA